MTSSETMQTAEQPTTNADDFVDLDGDLGSAFTDALASSQAGIQVSTEYDNNSSGETDVAGEQDAVSSTGDFLGSGSPGNAPQQPPVTTPDAGTRADGTTDANAGGFSQLAEHARRLGISVDGMQSEGQLAAAVLSQIERMQPQVRMAQDMAPYADEFRQYVNNKQAPPQAPAQAPAPVSKDQWDAAEYFDKQYGGPVFKNEHRELVESGQVIRDPESGDWTARPGYEALVAASLPGLNAAQTHMSKFWQTLSSANPYEKFYGVLKEPLVRDVRSLVGELLAEREQATKQTDVVSQFENEHRSWLYQTDPSSGRSVPTDRGQQFFQTVAELRTSGISEPSRAIEIASRMLGVTAQATSQLAVVPVTPAAAVPPVPSAIQSLQNQAAQTKQSFLDGAKQRAGYAPSYSSPVGTGSESAPEVFSPNELDSMFTNALRVASATP